MYLVYDGRGFWSKVTALIGIRDPAVHHERRKRWNRAFSTAALKEFQPRIQYRVQQVVDALEERQREVVDLAEWIGFFTQVH